MTKYYSRSVGFSLLEIILVMAIVAILTMLVVPSYQASRLRAMRADGKVALLQIASAQEHFYAANNTYSTVANPLSNEQSFRSNDGSYIVTVTACDGGDIVNCFVATASPQGVQRDDNCENLTLSDTGWRGSSSGNAVECWQR